MSATSEYSDDVQVIKWRQHLTLQQAAEREGCIWLHACSVGEVGSVAPLIRQLVLSGYQLHLTVVTATGFAHARRLLGDSVSLSYLPWDLPGLFERFVSRLKPSLLLLAETEFWPGMLSACARHNIPVVGINTRISDRSFPRYHATRLLWKSWLKPVSLFLAQSDIDARRLVAMGVEQDKVQAVGNLKYAIKAPQTDSEQLRRKIDPSGNRPILLIASTHDKEDERLLAMWPVWHQHCPDLLTVIVPRHPQRFEQVARCITEQGLKLHRWSEDHDCSQADVVLVDAMGVLAGLYTVADLVIIAGSLSNIGGHNPLEAAICGRGVITGPYIQNFREIMELMQHEQAAIICSSDSEMENTVARLLKQPQELKQLHGKATLFIQDKSGVLDSMLEAIQLWLPASGSEHD